MGSLELWSQEAQKHDPLCATPELPLAGCFGCLLVALRSDATHEEDPAVRASALAALEDIISLAQAHLDEVRDGSR